MAKIVIVYASGLGRTRLMAETIAEGVKTVPSIELILKDAYDLDIKDLADADVIILGGSTYKGELNKAMIPVLTKMETLDLKGKVGIAFGSYGWSGEGVPTIINKMKELGLNVIEPGLMVKQEPKKEDLEKCFDLGRTAALAIS